MNIEPNDLKAKTLAEFRREQRADKNKDGNDMSDLII